MSVAKKSGYNLFLYEERRKQGVGRRAFARWLGVSVCSLYWMEKGYVKPSKKTIAKVRAKTGKDFYDAESSYPTERTWRKEKPYGKNYYIAFGVLFLLGVLAVGAAFGVRAYAQAKGRDFYGATYLSAYDGIVGKGSPTYSFVNETARREIYAQTGDESLVTVKAGNAPSGTEFRAYYWTNAQRVSCFLTTDAPGVKVYVDDYRTETTYLATYVWQKEGVALTSIRVTAGTSLLTEAQRLTLFSGTAERALRDWRKLLQDELGENYDLRTLNEELAAGKTKEKACSVAFFVLLLAGAGIAITAVFRLGYGWIGKKKTVRVRRCFAAREPLKKDVRAFPFLPEGALYLIGVAIVFAVPAFLAFYALDATGALTTGASAIGLDRTMAHLLYIGVFVLYFLDLGKSSGKRILRDAWLFFCLYVLTYFLEVVTYSYAQDAGTLLLRVLDEVTLPNPFGSVCLYFLIAACLFVAPKWANTKKKLGFYRLLSFVPLCLLVGMTVLSKIVDRQTTWDVPVAVRLLLNSEKIVFSAISVGFLYGVYFLRLYFQRKYGKEGAERYFAGNRYLWVKNAFVCVLILAVCAVDYAVRRYPVADMIGLGKTWQAACLAPLFLLYRPKIGRRNVFAEKMTLTFYTAAYAVIYALACAVIVWMSVAG